MKQADGEITQQAESPFSTDRRAVGPRYLLQLLAALRHDSVSMVAALADLESSVTTGLAAGRHHDISRTQEGTLSTTPEDSGQPKHAAPAWAYLRAKTGT